MNAADLIQAAVRNETARHDAALRAQGLRPRVAAGVWRCADPAAGPFHAVIPQSATVEAAAIRDAVAEVLARRADLGVLDPWSAVDLSDLGFALDEREYWAREPGGARPMPPPELDVREVQSPAELADFAWLGVVGFGGTAARGPSPAWQPGLLSDTRTHFYLGSVEGAPVAASQAVVDSGVVGVYGVATIPTHRRRGYGDAMTWAALVSASHLPAVLEPSAMGAGVYRRMGFRPVGRHRAWLRRNGPRDH